MLFSSGIWRAPPLEISGNIWATGTEWKLLTPDFRYRHPFITYSILGQGGEEGPVCTTPHCWLTRDFPPISPDYRISTAFVATHAVLIRELVIFLFFLFFFFCFRGRMLSWCGWYHGVEFALYQSQTGEVSIVVWMVMAEEILTSMNEIETTSSNQKQKSLRLFKNYYKKTRFNSIRAFRCTLSMENLPLMTNNIPVERSTGINSCRSR